MAPPRKPMKSTAKSSSGVKSNGMARKPSKGSAGWTGNAAGARRGAAGAGAPRSAAGGASKSFGAGGAKPSGVQRATAARIGRNPYATEPKVVKGGKSSSGKTYPSRAGAGAGEAKPYKRGEGTGYGKGRINARPTDKPRTLPKPKKAGDFVVGAPVKSGKRPAPAKGKQRPNSGAGGFVPKSARAPRASLAQPYVHDPDQERALGGEQIEGRQAVRELLRAGKREVRELLISMDLDDAPVMHEIISLALEARVAVREYSRARLDRTARTESHQGVVARVQPLTEYSVGDLCEIDENGTQPFLIALDSVTDPHNLGAVLRSALLAGATGVILPRHRSSLITPTAAKAAAGAIEYLRIAVAPGMPAALQEAEKRGLWRVGLDGSGREDIWSDAFGRLTKEPIVLVLGAEGTGLADLTMKRCDMIVRIPQQNALDSLNVSAAGAVACYEVARRRAIPSD